MLGCLSLDSALGPMSGNPEVGQTVDDVGSCLTFMQGPEAQNKEPPAWPPETGRKAWENSRAQGPPWKSQLSASHCLTTQPTSCEACRGYLYHELPVREQGLWRPQLSC